MANMLFSPFEESGIVSRGWLGSHWNSLDILTITSNLWDYFDDYIDYNEQRYWIELAVSPGDAFDQLSNTVGDILDTNYDMVLWVLCIVFVTKLYKYSMSTRGRVFGRIVQMLARFVYDDIVVAYLGHYNNRYLPYILYLFYFIMVGNLFGLIPSFFPLTSQLSTTLMLSFTCWFCILLLCIYLYGRKFLCTFYPSKVPVELSTFLMFIEFISWLVRLASLSLRLFANIVAGHILLDTITVFVYAIVMTVNTSISYTLVVFCAWLVIMLFVLLVFELLIAFPQAYIFVVLVVIYLRDAISIHTH